MNPVSEIKSNITPGKVIAFFVTGLAFFAILDLLGKTDLFLRPVSYLKAWNEARKANA